MKTNIKSILRQLHIYILYKYIANLLAQIRSMVCNKLYCSRYELLSTTAWNYFHPFKRYTYWWYNYMVGALCMVQDAICIPWSTYSMATNIWYWALGINRLLSAKTNHLLKMQLVLWVNSLSNDIANGAQTISSLKPCSSNDENSVAG